MDLAEAIYTAARLMPKQEEYRLTAQMIRAAISIPANIAEGNLRATRKDYAHFISIAQGSAAELETLLLLAERAKLLQPEVTTPLLNSIDPIGRMLNRLHARLASPA
ncbi:MAG: four helix bundle protein [Hyphomonadaceae bacterium]|nr:four helix bundle protein [Hyphomonadaceae bacterium]